MKSNKYLNYTHGLMLQDLCDNIIQSERDDKYKYINLIKEEQKNLRLIDSPIWNIPISYYCYYEYLDKILKILESNSDTNQLSSICNEIKNLTRKKIYALFLTQELSCWPSLKSVFEAAQNDQNYIATLVYTPFSHNNLSENIDYYNEYKNMGLPVVNYNEYQLDEESPDIVFIFKPYANVPPQYQIKALESVVPRIVYIPYGMEITEDLAKFGFQYYAHYKAWRHCVYGEIVKKYAIKHGYRNGENIAVWGHPRADIYQDMSSLAKNIPEEWKKIIGNKKVILWTPHHLVNLDSNSTGTWLIWGEKILRLALNTPDVVFIFRPHPLMFGALINNEHLSLKQVEKIKELIDRAPNIIYDTSYTYINAVAAADAIITDGTTFCIEFLYSKRPILLTPRNMDSFYLYKEMMESYYIANKFQDIIDFVNMVKENRDPLLERRIDLYNKIFFIPKNATVGENIMRNIKHDLDNECKISLLLSEIREEKLKIIRGEEEYKALQMDIQFDYPLVSILVLCYKNLNLLYDMLDSIFIQDYPRIHLIVSDDGSEDFDVKEIEQYIQSNKRRNIEDFQVLRNEKNMGTVRHVEKVFALIKGEYFVFTAADDRFVDKTVITSYVNAFVDNPSSVWLVAKCYFVTPDYTNVLYTTPTQADLPFFLGNDSRKLYSRWSRRGLAIPCQMAFTKRALDIIGGVDLNYVYLEDWPMVLKLLRNGYMPIFLNKVVAIHSTGGITNSNKRYGKEVRKLFYLDKYTLFKREVEPYKHLLYPEDLKALKKYMVEIMDRNYFLNIDFPEATITQLFIMIIKKPIRFLWLFENFFIKYQNNISQKKLFALSQTMLLFALLFIKLKPSGLLGTILSIVAYVEIVIALLLSVISIICYPLKKYFDYKKKLRRDLVN